MTRDDFLCAINEVFGVAVWAATGYWNVQIEGTPPREIVFSSTFVSANVGTEGISPKELRDMLRAVPESKWNETPNGGLVLDFPWQAG